MNEDLKKHIKEAIENYKYCPVTLLRDILDYIEKLENPLQPIETAPKDGTIRRILAYSQTGGFFIAEIHSDGLNVLSESSGWQRKYATHWMPLPKLPDTEG